MILAVMPYKKKKRFKFFTFDSRNTFVEERDKKCKGRPRLLWIIENQLEGIVLAICLIVYVNMFSRSLSMLYRSELLICVICYIYTRFLFAGFISTELTKFALPWGEQQSLHWVRFDNMGSFGSASVTSSGSVNDKVSSSFTRSLLSSLPGFKRPGARCVTYILEKQKKLVYFIIY